MRVQVSRQGHGQGGISGQLCISKSVQRVTYGLGTGGCTFYRHLLSAAGLLWSPPRATRSSLLAELEQGQYLGMLADHDTHLT